jgi:hypothetical protein
MLRISFVMYESNNSILFLSKIFGKVFANLKYMYIYLQTNFTYK